MGLYFGLFFYFVQGKGIANTWKRGIYEDFRATCFFLGGGLAGVAWHSIVFYLGVFFIYLKLQMETGWQASGQASYNSLAIGKGGAGIFMA